MNAFGATAAGRRKASANDKIQMGFIGLGQQAMYLLSSFMAMVDVRVVAGCDVYDVKRDRFVRRVKEREAGDELRTVYDRAFWCDVPEDFTKIVRAQRRWFQRLVAHCNHVSVDGTVSSDDIHVAAGAQSANNSDARVALSLAADGFNELRELQNPQCMICVHGCV